LATKKSRKKSKRSGGGIVPGLSATPAAIVEMGRTTKLTSKRTSEAEGIAYRLSDGAKVTMVPIITSVERSLSKYNITGEPIYQLQAGFFVKVDVPAKLKRKAGKR
jgi:hypothetical protein